MAVGIIGLGGTGKYITNDVIKKARENHIPDIKGLIIDIDSQDYTVDKKLGIIETFIEVSDLKDLVDRELKKGGEFKKWWIDSYSPVGKLSGSSGANQIRINGRLAFYNEYLKIRKSIETLNKSLLDIIKQRAPEQKPRYFVITSLGGGTGSGIFIDILFLLKEIIPKGSRVYGVFIDGTVTQRFQRQQISLAGQTFYMSFASLTELEYWIRNSEKFEDIKMGKPLSEKPVDIAFIVQDRTVDDKTFNFKETIELKEAYYKMVADFVYSISVSQTFSSYLEANDLKVFDNVQDSPEYPSVRYGSFAISHLTFDRDKASTYLASKWALENIFHTEHKGKEVCFEFDIPLWEYTEGQFSNYLRTKSNVIKTIENVIVEAKKALNSAVYAKNIEIQRVIKKYQLPPSEGFKKLWDEYKEKIKNELTKISENLLTSILQKIDEQLENFIIQDQVEIEDLLKGVERLKSNVEKSLIYIDNKYVVDLSKEIKGLSQAYANIIKVKPKKLGIFKHGERQRQVNFYQHLLDRYKNAFVRAILNEIEKDFYNELEERVEALINALRVMKANIEEAKRELENEKNKYTVREIPFDEEREKLGEFLFNMKFEINKRLLDESLYEKLENLFDAKELRRLLYQGKGTQLGFLTILKRYDELAREKKFERLNSLNILKEGIIDFYRMEIKDKIAAWLYKEIDIVYVIESFLKHQVYEEVKKLQGLHDKLEGWKNKWSTFFGKQVAENLVKDENLEDKEEWIKLAFTGLLLHLSRLIQPFVKYSNIVRNYYLEQKYNGVYEKFYENWTTIFVPDTFRYSDFLSVDPNIRVERKSTEKNSIEITSFIIGFPLHSLELLKNYSGQNIAEKYKKHKETLRHALLSNKKVSEIPWHVDKRFYIDPDFDIDITEESKVGFKKEVRWVFTFGIAFGMITRENRKWLLPGGRKINTLPLTLEYLAKHDDLRNSLKREIRDKLQKLYVKLENKDLFKSELDKYMKNAYMILKKVRFPKTVGREEQYREWQEIVNSIAYDEMGNRASSNMLPFTYEETLELFG